MKSRYKFGLAMIISAVFKPELALASPSYMSLIRIEGALQVEQDPNNGGKPYTDALVWYVDAPSSAEIKYDIGWDDGPSDATRWAVTRSAITQPEYNLTCDDSCTMPPGVSFNVATGIIAGTPSAAGVWRYHAAVRDKINGEHPYRGGGYWWTNYQNINGKTYVESNTGFEIIILKNPGDKEINLICSSDNEKQPRIIISLDSLNGYIFQYDNAAKKNFLSKINTNSDIIGWRRGSLNFTLDRTTGDLQGVDNYANQRWHCDKRSSERKF